MTANDSHLDGSHVHRWHLDSPTPGRQFVKGRCACSATREFLAHEIVRKWRKPRWEHRTVEV